MRLSIEKCQMRGRSRENRSTELRTHMRNCMNNSCLHKWWTNLVYLLMSLIPEAQAGECHWVWCQPGLCHQFKRAKVIYSDTHYLTNVKQGKNDIENTELFFFRQILFWLKRTFFTLTLFKRLFCISNCTLSFHFNVIEKQLGSIFGTFLQNV